MNRIAAISLLAVALLIGGCSGLGDREGQTSTVDVSLEDVRALLSAKLSVAEVIQELGRPSQDERSPHPDYINIVPGTLFYRLPGKDKYRPLWFRCLDDAVVSAHYDGIDVPGVGPVIHRMTVAHKYDGQKVWFEYSLLSSGRKRFKDYEALKSHLRSLPRSDVVTFMTNDTPSQNEPLTTQREIDELMAFCKANAIRFILELGG